MLTAEGAIYSLNEAIDSIALAGTYSANVNWGDGTSSVATVTPSQLATKLTIRIDYSLDSSGFFNSAARRQLLQASVDSIAGRMNDSLSSIQPGGSNSWTASFDHPSQTGVQATRSNLTIAANEIVVFAGARPMASPQLGQGGYGGYQGSGTAAFLSSLQSRGQGATSGSNATDFGPWGGSISFNSNTNWYFGTDPNGISSGQQDFVTVATHEFMHLLGFGTSPSWQRLVSGQTFIGSNARAQYDASGNVPLSSDRGHWSVDLQDGGAETLMDPNQQSGLRKTPTPLDIAGLKDIGWSVASSTIQVAAQHTFPDNGLYPMSIVVTGSQLGRVEKSLNANITNTAPSLTVPTNLTVVAGQTLDLANIGQLSDPGYRNTSASPATDETFTYIINWGDNSTNSSGTATIDQIGNSTRPTLASFDGSHIYTAAGTYTVRVTATDDDSGSVTKSFTVTVQPPPILSLTTANSSVVEDGSIATTVTISRSGGDLAQPLTVNLTSSDTSEATVAATVQFAAGEATRTVPLMPVDDNLLDGDQTVTITASAAGLASQTLNITVRDAESLFAEPIVASVFENAGSDSIGLRIRRSNTDVELPLTVNISGNDSSLAESITSVTIGSGQQQVELYLDAVDDDYPELSKTLTLLFSAVGYSGASASVSILDNEPPKFQNPINRLDVSGDGQVIPLDALQIINFINRQASIEPLDPESGLELPFYDVTGDYYVLPIDALQIINAINRGLTTDGEGESAPALIPPASLNSRNIDLFMSSDDDEWLHTFDKFD